MLTELVIKNFAIIDDIRVSFDKGFTVLTGETGAGKSMIISAVNLLLGSRGSADLVRTGSEAAELAACFEISPESGAARVLKEQGLGCDEGLIVRRLISSSGKSRVFVNSRACTLEFLKQVTSDLAAISSQHAHQGLLKPENHLDILDEFSGTSFLKSEVKSIYNQLSPLKKEMGRLKEKVEGKKKEQDFLSFQIQEIEAADIQPDEDRDLEKKREILLSAAQSFEAVNSGIHEIYDREGSLVETVAFLVQSFERAGLADSRIEKVVERLSSIRYELQDIAVELRDISSAIDLDPASLEQVDARLDLVARLKRKYGSSLEQVFETYDDLKDQIAGTDRMEQQIRDHEKQIKTLEKTIRKKALELSEKRKKAAIALAKAASHEMAALEMKQARFEVEFDTLPPSGNNDVLTADKEKISPSGMDKIQFLLSPNPGEDLKPLAKIASGGELSRIVLALKAVLSGNQSLETLIFDEVDAGIGGATSQKVGMKLRQLSVNHQVICITHLAQIAKFAGHQYRIQKKVIGNRTSTTIIPLSNGQERIEEIARMIGGSDISKATLDHAKEMLEKALA